MKLDAILQPGNWGTRRTGTVAERFVIRNSGSNARAGQSVGGFRGIALVGLADDLGVVLNGGRPGAQNGPDGFRKALSRYGRADSMAFDQPLVNLIDFGNIVGAQTTEESKEVQTLEETHRRVTFVVRTICEQGFFPLAVGGGHDLTFAAVRGVQQFKNRQLAGAYIDAHLDVRETIGSGMPFRKLLEMDLVNHLEVAGLDPFCNTREHRDWFLGRGGVIQDLERIDWSGKDFVSLDLDAFDQAFAPGVSAPHPAGLAKQPVCEIMETCGESGQLCYLDLMELNPDHDPEGKTARLAAHLFLCFLQGWMRRGQ